MKAVPRKKFEIKELSGRVQLVSICMHLPHKLGQEMFEKNEKKIKDSQ
jgi:hypothetical protein